MINKAITKAFFFISLLICTTTNVFAQVTSMDDGSGPFFGKEAKGKWIVGLKAAKIDNNFEDIKDADAFGIILGYEFDRPVGANGTSTVELEYLSGDETDLAGIGEWEADILNLFFTYRSAGDLYLKLKLGLSYSDINIDFPAFGEDNEDVSLAGGIGIGYHIGDYGVVELEYSADSGDNDFGILGLNALLEF